MAVIEFEHVCKSYRLGSRTSLREALWQAGRRLVGREGSAQRSFWALDDVTFQVEPGEVLGIIGPNGAGKSTILKLLSKVTKPTRGHIRTQGRLAALIELGAGFHPDLTGRENIYLNGAILGLKRREISAQFDSIVEFAELAGFIDTPVKRYSSGMYVRLAFAVAAHVKADLLLVDEVLSVGDASFQRKSLAKMSELRDSGATIIFVSHQLSAVRTFCSRVLLLRGGRIAAEGAPSAVIETYQQLAQGDHRKAALAIAGVENHAAVSLASEEEGSGPRRLSVELGDLAGRCTREFQPSDGLRVRCRFSFAEKILQPEYELQVRRRVDGFICFTRYSDPDPALPYLQGEGMFEARIE